MKTARQRKMEKGATLTELIILTPILLTLILASVDLGRLVFARQVMTDLSREAANLVSRGASAEEAFSATLIAEQAFDLEQSGMIIISRVRRQTPTNDTPWVVEQDVHGRVSGMQSHIGMLNGVASIPKMKSVERGVTFTAVEMFHTFEPAFNFATLGLDIYPTVLYDAAFF